MERDGSAESADAGAGPAEGQARVPQAFDAAEADPKRQLQSLLECLSGLFYRCELSAPWRMSFVSKGVDDLTGYTAEELDQQAGWVSIMLEQDRGAVESEVAAAVAERRTFDLAYRIRHKAGEIRWVSERGHAVYAGDGTPLFLEGVITDISGRKQAEELQRTLIARWRKTLDMIPQMVSTRTPDGSDEYYNSRWADFTGDSVGQNSLSRMELVHPDDQEHALREWQRCFDSGTPYEAQYRLRHVSGEYRWILSRGYPEVGPDGQIIRWYGTCTDIHEQVCAQEALRASEAVNRSMIEASPDCVSLLDMNGCIVFMNEASAAALGLASGKELVG